MTPHLPIRPEDHFRGMDAEYLGGFGEALWKRLFLSCPSLEYIPLCNIFERGAPMARGGASATILPDFNVIGRRGAFLADSKAKRSAVLYRNANELRHGINSKNYADYVSISERLRQHCFLVLFECFTETSHAAWSGALLVQSLTKITGMTSGFSTMKDMVYWPRKSFQEVGKLTPLLAWDIGESKGKVPVELSLAIETFINDSLGDSIQQSLF